MTWLPWGAIKLLLGGWLTRLTTALGAALTWIKHNPALAIIIALCALCTAEYWHYSSRVQKLSAQLATANQTIGKMKAASAQAAVDQAKVNQHPAIISGQIAEASNEQSKSYYDEGRRAGIAYANAHRVRNGASSGVGSNPDLPIANQATEEHDGPGEAPGMVALSAADYDLFVSNSLRLAKVRQDAESLIASGVAQP